MKQLIKALLEAQKTIKHAELDSKNPHFNSEYASLESVIDAVKAPSLAQGLVFIQDVGDDEKGFYVKTILMHESGEQYESKAHIILEKNTMQGLGSAISYLKRYQLSTLFGVGKIDLDDDGHEATKHAPRPQTDKKIDPSHNKVVNTSTIIGTAEDLSHVWNKDELAETKAPDNPLGDQIIKIGKMKGQKYSEADPHQLMNLINWLQDQSEKEGKPLKGGGAELVDLGTKYLDSLGESY
jgi:hypothetical protein